MRRSPVRPTIQKFGGASLDGGRSFAHALALAARGPRPAVVVVSALAGVTDGLLALARPDGAEKAAQLAASLRARHLAAARVAVPPGRERRRLFTSVREAFDEVQALARLPAFARELSPNALDHLLSRGEDLSARIFAAGLAARGVASELIDARELIATDGRAGAASPLLAPTDRRVRRRLRPLLARGRVQVVPGFLGAGPDGRVVTLGRGGSDLTATLLARGLAASALVLWKDVAGFLTADPRVVSDARVIPQLHPREAAELAYYGARVLHPRALIPLAGRGIPIYVRPFADPQSPGTEISARRTLSSYPVKALSAIPGQALITVSGNGMLGVPGIAARTFAALHREGISVSLISQASSEHSICLTVPEGEAPHARDRLRDVFAEEMRRREIDGVELQTGLSTISVVGLGMAGTPGIAARVFSALAADRVNVIAIAQGSSELNISFVVSAKEASRALSRVHDAFQLSKIGGGAASEQEQADVVLLGFGQVGRTLARMLVSSPERRLRLCAVVDRGGFVFHPRGVSAKALARLVETKRRGKTVGRSRGGVRSSPREAVAFLGRHALARPILVDVTADSTGRLLESAAATGFDVVLANKRPLSGARRESDRLEAGARRAGRRIRYEATVGAGLPILDTYRKLVESGDRVHRIEGCLSGTIGHVLSELEQGERFSTAVRDAVALGYAEPDPREDLNGADVGRKALILARLLGFAGGPSDVAVASLIPESARRVPLPRFLRGLERFDVSWERRLRASRSRDRLLRYVASVSRRGARVGLAEVPPTSPFAGLRGTANLVAFTTERYRSIPLVIQGPGAGLEVTAAGLFNDLSELAAS
jgi:bifunctional aspartokinase / homoserine dehydrogenase 1